MKPHVAASLQRETSKPYYGTFGETFMRKVLALLAVAALATPVFAGILNAGELFYNPALNGTGAVGTSGPFYTSGTPAWLTPANLDMSLSSPIQGIPGFAQFEGTVESFCYNIPAGGMGIAYRINLAANSAPRLVRASVAAANWGGITVSDAGSDGTGSSTPAANSPNWSDGDPYFIERDAVTAAPQWVFRLGTNGTVIDPNGRSALVWFETDGVTCVETSISLLDGGAAGAARVLTVGVPSPAAAGLGLLGLTLVSGLRRRLA